MLPSGRTWVSILKLGLLVSTCGWGISFFFTFASWKAASGQLYEMGANRIPYDPLMDYWLRMASCVFGCIGIGSALASVHPANFMGLIRLLGPFHFIIGTTLAIAAYRNHLTPDLHPTFIPDIVFCFLAGLLIQVPLSRESYLRRKSHPDKHSA